MKVKILAVLLAILICAIAGYYLLYNFYKPTKATGTSRDIEFTTSTDYFMIETGINVPDISDNSLVDSVIATFNDLPIFLRLVNPDVGVINHANFDRLQAKGHFWYFSAQTYQALRTLAEAYYAKYPNGRAILELADHNARSDAETQSLAASFPKAKFVAANYVDWNREKARELVNSTMPNHLTHPSLYAVSFHVDVTEGLNDPAENVALFWDTFFDASHDIEGNSVKIEWPTKAFFLSLGEIKTIPRSSQLDVQKDEARRFGVLIAAYYDYVQSRGDDSRVNNAIPIRFAGLGDYSSLTTNGKNIAAIFAHISKHKMTGVHPPTNSGINLRHHLPVYGIAGHTNSAGYAIIFSNTGSTDFTLRLPDNFERSLYSSVSTSRGNTFVVNSSNDIVLSPYEVIAVYKTGSLSLPNGSTTATPTPTPTATAGASTQTPTPTTTLTGTPSSTPSTTNTPTITPTHTLTPTRTPTSTPTITNTPTLTPSNTPTPILAAFCDRADCGTCGWKDTAGTCHPDGSMPDGTKCCFSTCISDACVAVPGVGVDKCQNNASCVALTPVIKYVVIEPSALPTSISNPGNKVNTVVPASNTTATAKGNPQPPVSGNSIPTYLLVIPAILVIVGAIIF